MADPSHSTASVASAASTAQPVPPPPPPPPPPASLPTDVVVPIQSSASHQTMMGPGTGRALFSTELGTRPPRNVPGPPFPPVIVRSDELKGVIDAGRFWQQKFRWFCLSIFPDCGWTIDDLWDPEDIHLDGPEHYRKVLDFISRETAYNARLYAQEWSHKYPERTATIVGAASLTDIYDPANPLAIVDKIFVHGESNDVPRGFLWHVAQVMRTTMLDLRKAQNQAKAYGNPVALPPTPTDGSAAEKSAKLSEGSTVPVVVEGSSAQSGGSSKSKSKTNRKQSRSRPPKQSEPLVSSDTSAAQTPAITMQSPTVASRQGPAAIPAFYNQPPGTVAMGFAAPAAPPGFLNPSAPFRSLDPVPYHQQMPAEAWFENRSRGPSMNYSEAPPSIPFNGIHPAHNYPFTLEMGQPQVGPFNPMQPPFVQGPHASSLPASGVQPYNSNMVPPNRFPPQSPYVPGSPMAGGYIQQPPDNRGVRGMAIGDMTNNPYYACSTSGHSTGQQQQPYSRRSSLYDHGCLYDPYNGTNPAFNEHNNARKTGRSALVEQSDRPRKASVPEIGSGSNSQATNRPDNYYATSGRYASYGNSRPHRESDPLITEDQLTGCDATWIGPENKTVNELFVNVLPPDADRLEVQHMFVQHTNTKPVNVNIRHPSSSKHAHAFITFNSTSDAKAVLAICNNASPRLRGICVHITVPRRFFQKPPDRPLLDVKPKGERKDERKDERKNQRKDELKDERKDERKYECKNEAKDESNDEHTARAIKVKLPKEKVKTAPQSLPTKTLYSSQDARSDLQKNKPQKLAHKGSTPKNSPPAHKTKSAKPSNAGQVDSRKELFKENVTTRNDKTTPPMEKAQDLVDVGPEKNNDLKEVGGSKQSTTPVEGGKILTSKFQAVAQKESISRTEENQSSGVFDMTAEENMIRDCSEAPAEIKVDPIELHTEKTHDGREALPGPTSMAKAYPSTDQGLSVDPRTASAEELRQEHASNVKSSTSIREKAHLGDKNLGAAPSSVVPKVGSDDPPIGSPQVPSPTNHGNNHPNTISYKKLTWQEPISIEPRSTKASPKIERSSSTLNRTPERSAQTPKGPDLVTTSMQHQEPVPDQKMVETTSKPAVADAVKKSGPQQTTSLNPFAKTKAQRQKEKEQKKRDKNKKIEEKASKSKGDKPESTSSTDQQIQDPNSIGSNVPAKVESTGVTSGTTEQMPIGAKSSKSKNKNKGKARDQGPPLETSGTDKTTNDAGTVSGKQLGGTITILPNKTGSVTCKAEVTVTENQIGKDLTPAQSPRPDDEQAAEAAISLLSLKESSMKACVVPTSAKDKKTGPAAHHLSIDPNPSLPIRSVHQSCYVSPTAASNSPASFAANTSTVQHMPDTDNLSVSSSNTTLNNETAINRLSSPTSEAFFTPMQTPAFQQTMNPGVTEGPPIVQDEASKPKKKKPKKKKKKSLVPATGVESSTPTVNNETSAAPVGITSDLLWSDDPFGDQMSHIDAIRKSVNDPNSYYYQMNKELADRKMGEQAAKATAGRSEADQGTSQEEGSEDLFRHLEGFFKELPAGLRKGSSSKAVTKEDLH